jgi:hypothetical protein
MIARQPIENGNVPLNQVVSFLNNGQIFHEFRGSHINTIVITLHYLGTNFGKKKFSRASREGE